MKITKDTKVKSAKKYNKTTRSSKSPHEKNEK